MSREMLINVSQGEECRIALLDNGRLQELYMERTSATSHVGNIYKGRVTNVEASIQAAFVDFGLGRNGFLHISDLMPSYFGRDGGDIQESVGRKLSRRDRPPIQRCLRRGDEIVVQIIKEGIGTKGPTLSTYISIPGRILVMMPGMGKFGVSRKIEDDEERRRLRTILDGLKPIKDVGFIIRTAGIGKTGEEIERDLTYLTRLWDNIQRKMREPAPVELYTEGDLVTRTVRDAYSSDLDRIVVDSREVGVRIKDFFKIALPRNRSRIELYDSPVPLFHQANIEREIEMMNSRHVPLPSGGSLVIDSTEAVVAIDVNSGKFRDHNDAEMTAFKTDMEAADEIPRQLKLRDLGGVIICDFIDLRFERNRRELEERLHANFKNDRAKTKVLRMSQFGIIELTRQRMRPSLKRSIYCDCPHCKGGGLVKTAESMSLDVMRRLAIAAYDPKVARIEMTVGSEVGVYVLNKKRAELTALEADSGRRIIVRQDAALGIDETKLKLLDTRDGLIFLEELGMDPNDERPEDPRRAQPARRDRRGGRGGRPLPQSRGQSARGMDDEDDELDQAEDAVDQHDDDLDSTAAPLAAPIRIRAIPKVPLGKVIATLLTDEDEIIDEHESSVIEVDEPNEPLGDGPQEFEEDYPRGRGFDRGRADGNRNARNANSNSANRSGQNPANNPGRDSRFDPRRDNRSAGRSGAPLESRGGRTPGRPDTGRSDTGRPDSQSESRPGLPRPIDRVGNVRSDRPGFPQSRDQRPIDNDAAQGEFNERDDANGNLNEDRGESGDGPPRRRRRRGRRGRGHGQFDGPRDDHARDDQPRDGQSRINQPEGDQAREGASHGGDEDDSEDVNVSEHANAAFGTSESPSSEKDSVGSAGEEIDADAIDSEFAENLESSDAGVEDADADGDQPRKRRRRRGGRRHRRSQSATENAGLTVSTDRSPGTSGGDNSRNAAELNASAEDSIEDATNDSSEELPGRPQRVELQEDNDDRDLDADLDDSAEDRIVAVTPFPPIAEDEFDDAREDLNDSLQIADTESVSPPPPAGRPASLRDREIESGIITDRASQADHPVLQASAAESADGASAQYDRESVEKPSRSKGGRAGNARRAGGEGRARAGRSPTLRGRQIEAGITSESAADNPRENAAESSDSEAADYAADETENPNADSSMESGGEYTSDSGDAESIDAVPAKGKRQRGGRAASSRAAKSPRRTTRKPPSTVPPAATPDSSSSTGNLKSSPSASERTGSTDAHLVDDIPVDPESPRRPRSYEDLDAVPDDFD